MYKLATQKAHIIISITHCIFFGSGIQTHSSIVEDIQGKLHISLDVFLIVFSFDHYAMFKKIHNTVQIKIFFLFLNILFYCIYINGLDININKNLEGFRLCKQQLPIRLPRYLKDAACAHANSVSYRFVASCIRRSNSVIKSAEIIVELCSKVVS